MVGSKEAGVSRVMSFRSSSRVYPTASFAAILAMGKPVALEARAEERGTRGVSPVRPAQALAHRAGLEPPADRAGQLLRVPGDRAAGPAEGEGGPDDDGIADLADDLAGPPD